MNVPYTLAVGASIGVALTAGALSYALAERIVAPAYRNGRGPRGLRALAALLVSLPAAVVVLPAYAAGYTAGVVWRGLQLFGVSVVEGFSSGSKDYSA